MTRLLLLFALLGSFSAPAQAQAPFRKMGWGDSTPGHQDITPNCAALADQSKLVISFVAPKGINNMQGIDGYVDFCTKPYPIPPWWTFSPYFGCRSDSLSASVDFSQGPSSFPSAWGGRQGQLFLGYEPSPTGSWQMSRIRFAFAPDPGSPIALQEGQEYYAIQIVFGNPDVGCTGCEYPACFVLNGLLLLHDNNIVDPTTSDFNSMYCRWMGGQADCPFIVPTVPTTWGRMKDSYR